MGRSKEKQQAEQQSAASQAGIQQQRQRTGQQTQDFTNRFQQAANQQTGDYSNIMGQFQNIMNRPDTTMSPEYKAHMDRALGGYGQFAETGGFSPQDIQDIRARSIAPTRAVFQRGMDEVARNRALSGSNTGSNAALAKMARESNAAISDANVNANAGIAQMVQQGKLAGLGGMGQLGGQQLGLQNAIDQQNIARLFGGAEGMRGLYGTNPAMAGMFGNQVLGSSGQQIDTEGLGLQGASLANQRQQQHTPWWKTALSAAGTVAPYAAMAMSDKNMKEDIKPIRGLVSKKLAKLPIYTWNYKGDDTKHIGPVAQHFKKQFGVGDGKNIHLVDVMGVVLASQKEAVKNG